MPFKKGDVLADVGGGLIKHYSSTGTLLDTLDTTTKNQEGDGMCFDAAGNLYSTQGFEANTVSKFNSSGELLEANWGSGYNEHPESCVVDSSGHIFVGQPDGGKEVLEFDTSGKPVASFSLPTEDRGTDWIDLAADQCTLHYTSEGSAVKAFNVCTDKALPDFADGLPGGSCYAHRILPNGEELVACTSEVVRLDSSGKVVKEYLASEYESSFFFAINLDPDGETFWTADYGTGKITRINIATGVAVTSFTAELSGVLGGISVVGEITAPPKITLAPLTATNVVGTEHTVTATVDEKGAPVQGAGVSFVVTGANPQTGSANTNASGEASFTYKGEKEGTDTIVASFKDKEGNTDTSNTVEKIWTAGGTPKETMTTTVLSGGGQSMGSIDVKEGTSVTDQATITGENAASAGGTLAYAVYSDSACTTQVASAGSGSVVDGKAAASEAETLPAGTYYWQAVYSGDANNAGSKSACGSEVETVEGAPPRECKAAGSGRFRVKKEVQTLADKLSTKLTSPQTLRFKWNLGGKNELLLDSLTQASCTERPHSTAFHGTGTASVNGTPGYEVRFVITVTSGGKLVLSLTFRKGKEHMIFHDAAKAKEVITTS